MTGLHPLWYIGTLTAVAGMLVGIAKRRHSLLLTVYAVAIVVMLSATGVLLERGPRFPYIFTSYAYGDEILRTGAIDYSQTYVSWPGWHLVTAIAVGASKIDPTILLTWLPLWLLMATLAAFITLFRRFRLPRHQRWIATALAATTFLGPVYPLAGSLAILIATYAVALLLEAYLGRTGGIGSRLGMVLLMAALIPTHFLTSLVGVMVITTTSILVVTTSRRRVGPAPVLGIVFLAGYMFYVSIQVTTQLLPGQIQTVMNLERLFGSISTGTASAISGGSDEHVQVVRVRIAYIIGLAGLGFMGGLTALYRRVPLRRWILPVAWSVGGLGSLSVGSYSGEILARGSTLAAAGSIALASFLASVRVGRVLLTVAMLAAVLLSPIFLFGNELFDYIRPTELSADETLETRHPGEWALTRGSRTWYHRTDQQAGGPFVTVYGPLYDRTSAQIGTPDPPPMPYWSYDNGDVRIMVAATGTP